MGHRAKHQQRHLPDKWKLRKELDKATRLLKLATEEAKGRQSRQRDLENRLRELGRLQEADEALKAFRVAMRSMPEFGRMGGPIYAVQVSLDMRMLTHGFMYAYRGNPFDLSREVHYVILELTEKIKRTVMEELTKEGAIRA